jgi:hypothetical protein
MLRHRHLRVRVWEANDVVDAVLGNYDRLPDEIQNSPGAQAHLGAQQRLVATNDAQPLVGSSAQVPE